MENALIIKNRILPIALPLCKIKYENFVDYQIIGCLPNSFKELAKIISGVAYPNNFSLDYFGEGFVLISLNSGNYRNLLNFCQENMLQEVKLFVNLHENRLEDENKISAQYSIFNRELSPKKRKYTRDSSENYSTYTIKETEEHSSTSYENNSDDSKSKKNKCICRAKRYSPRAKRSEKFVKNCVYCY